MGYQFYVWYDWQGGHWATSFMSGMTGKVVSGLPVVMSGMTGRVVTGLPVVMSLV